MNENKITLYQNVWDTAKTVLGRKLVALNTCIIKEECSKINDLSSQLKNLQKTKTN